MVNLLFKTASSKYSLQLFFGEDIDIEEKDLTHLK